MLTRSLDLRTRQRGQVAQLKVAGVSRRDHRHDRRLAAASQPNETACPRRRGDNPGLRWPGITVARDYGGPGLRWPGITVARDYGGPGLR
jgi:hypothetical protein